MSPSKRSAPARERIAAPPDKDPSAKATERIIDVATTMFLGIGYERTGIDTVVAKARVSKRAFYAQFGSKADLFAAVVIRLAERNFPSLDAVPATGAPVEHLLERVALELIRISTTPESVALDRMVTAQVGRFPELARILYDFAGARTIGAVCKILEQAVARGELVIDDCVFASQHFLSATVLGPRRFVVLGLEDGRMTPKKLERLRRGIRLFVDGARGTASPKPGRPGPRRPQRT
ncbi:TetR/AcrR family transcriptional regulator [Rhodoplanes azumiensis]|uniref:TetR/AcrR family transcriptional regulator n=1 Tax=Rhodoplanes azumiensis TaxID=1897628 RepID=A0ABW5AJA8_9BRAD